jgi:transposase
MLMASEVVVNDDNAKRFLDEIGGWDGFEVAELRKEDQLAPDVLGMPSTRLIVVLQARAGSRKRCSRCGEPVDEIHDLTERRIRDLPIGDRDTYLIVPVARLRCPRCGPTTEAIPWVDRYQRMTKRLVEKIAKLASIAAIKHVAEWFGLSWDTVKQIDQRALERRLGPVDFQGVRRIAIDEFALHRGQTYATLVVDVDTRRVLWVGRGRAREHLRPFFTALGPAGCQALEAVVMDLAPAYVQEVRAQCPHAAIVADLFHVVARYGAEVLDRVRVDEMNRVGRAIRQGQPGASRRIQARRPFWRARWLLLSNQAHLAPPDQVRLQDLLEANQALFVVYVLKEDLKALWHIRDCDAARMAWAGWYERAMASGIAPLVHFAQRLAKSVEYVVNHARFPMHTSLVEGINNKIKVLKRVAYGYRDDAYFFLKIRAAFPGIPR